ncbi:MAG: hypothetical protein B7Z55_13780 [Planctomycetales bacterium 12-60-4]|nr:MAG: hypothetical protein B7Z55_13780 [Planctomycetales bacterium 12-60-4]
MRTAAAEGWNCCVVLSLAIGLTSPSCSGGNGKAKDQLKVFRASGVVTLTGKPVADALVRLYSPDVPAGSTGKTDKEGKFLFTTYANGDGAPAGRYFVGVVKYESPSEGGSGDADSPDYIPPKDVSNDSTIPVKPPKSLIPSRYADPTRSGFTAEVTEQGPNEFTFDMSE